jgi:hypothetical protein
VSHPPSVLTPGFLFTVGWNLAWTPLILFVIRAVFRVPLRAPLEVLKIGDEAIHGEEAYSLSMPYATDEYDMHSDVDADPYRRMSGENMEMGPVRK